MSFSRYSEYKPSGAEWIGEIPRHWDVGLLTRFARMKTGHTPSRNVPQYWEDCTIPWFGLADVWQLRDGKKWYLGETAEKISVLGLENSAAELLPAGTVVFSRTASVGFSGIMPVPMATTQDFWNWICGRRLVPEFLLLLFRAMSAEFQRITMGSTHKTVYQPDAASLRVCVPSIEEQSRIVEFLRNQLTSIDALISEQMRLLEILKEKCQATVCHAVSKGLEPDATMKSSGSQWMGQIPVHWTVLSLARLTTSRCDGPFGSGLKSEHYTDSGVRVIRLQNIRSSGFDGSNEAYIDRAYYGEMLGDHDVRAGDILIAGLGDDHNTVGRACVAPSGIEPAMVKADCFRFRIDRDRAIPEFIAMQLNAGAVADAGKLSSGSTRSRIPLSVMGARCIAMPRRKEQEEIVVHVQRRISEVARLVSNVERSIDLLVERRSALIYSVVTGKVDLRDAVGAEAA